MNKVVCFIFLTISQMSLAATSPAEIAAGKKLFEANGCVACHGADGKADTPTGKAVNARNFVGDAPEKYKQGYSEKAIATTIEKGVKGGSTGMQPYGSVIKDPKDRLLLAKFIMSLKESKK